MTSPDQSPISEAGEESEDAEESDDGMGERGSEDEEKGAAPSHLPFAPSSELPDTTTVDPSYIISLIRKLLPNNLCTQKSSQIIAGSVYSIEASKICPSEENMEGEFKSMKQDLDTEDDSNPCSYSILNDRYEGSLDHQFVDQTYPSTSMYDAVRLDTQKEEKHIASDDQESGLIDMEIAWEDSGCILWDLSANKIHSEFMVNNFLIEVLLASLHSSKSHRITEICLGILGNLACHDASSSAMVSKDGLVETVVDQLYLDDSASLSETFRILAVALQGSGSTSWAKALLSEETFPRIVWIMGNTLNTVLLEKSIEFLLVVINNIEVASILLHPWMKLGLPNLVMSLLAGEMSNLEDENKLERTSVLDPVLCLVEALSIIDCSLEMNFPNEELCHLVCRIIMLPDKFEYTSSCVSAVVIIANLLVDGQHVASQLSQDSEFIQALLETIPLVSDDPQARDALWCILARLLVRVQEKDISISSIHHLVSIFLEKSNLIMEDLDGHSMEDSGANPLNSTGTSAIVTTLRRIACIIERWNNTQKVEKTEDGSANMEDGETKAERLLQCCKKYTFLLSTLNA